MSVVVAYKYTTNPQDAKVGADGAIDWSRAKPVMSDYDPVAAEVGKSVAQASGTELIGITVGVGAVGASMARKNAMSKGFDRGVVVADDATADWNPTQYAAVLSQIVQRENDVDLVITGDASIDNGSRMTSALIGAKLGWPTFQNVESVEKIEGGYRLVQQVSGGTRTVEVRGPVVVATTSDAARVPVPSMKEILVAGKKPVEVVELSEFSTIDPRIEVTARAKPEARVRKNIVFTGGNAVNELIDALRTDGVL